MGRIVSRDVLFKLVFELCFHQSDIDNYYDHMLDDDDNADIDKDWITNIYTDIIDKTDELKNAVSKYLKGYTIERVFKVDLAILMLALYELKYTNTDSKIVANEAVELAKKYSTEKSSKFINGVIASAINDIRK